MEYIYLIHRTDYFNLNKNIYKLGRTKQNDPFKRINSYYKGSIIYLMIRVVDCVDCEKKLKKIFKNKYKLHTGSEYFQGDVSDVLCIR